jgi:outer membrane protein
MSKYFFLCFGLLCCLLASPTQAQDQQKLAHVNVDSIIPLMPEYVRARSELEAYAQEVQNRLKAEDEKMKAFYEKTSKEAGNLAPVELKKREAELMKMQENLQKMAADADDDLAKKEGELTKVVYERFEDALSKVAKEKGFHYVFDKKFFMYAEGGEDITALMIKELGLSK